MIGFLIGIAVGIAAGRGKTSARDRRDARRQGYEYALDELVLRGYISARARFDLLEELLEA